MLSGIICVPSLQNAVANLRKRIGINEENEKNVRGDGFSFSV